MPRILIAFASSEGQTRKLVSGLAQQLEASGDTVGVQELKEGWPMDLPGYDVVVLAASVHAGKHQSIAVQFASESRDTLNQRATAFLSVSVSAASDSMAGKKRAEDQVADFLKTTSWSPDLVATIGGALRLSEFSRPWRMLLLTMQRVFRRTLQKEGWPDLAADQELTDWGQLRVFGEQIHCLAIGSS